MNYQTKDDKMELYHGKFRQNGNCGYLLKPVDQRDDTMMHDVISDFSPTKEKVLRIKLISCQYIPSKLHNLLLNSIVVALSWISFSLI